MAGINTILSGMVGASYMAGSSVARNAIPPAIQSGNPGQDQFEVGQIRKSRFIGAEPSSVANGCKCGNCPQCVADKYVAGIIDSKAGSSDASARSKDSTVSPTTSADTVGENGSAASEMAKTVRGQTTKPDGTPLNEEELRQLGQLQKIDARVRAHEMAHIAAAGGFSKGGASFQYQKGPDGRNYAVSGEVQIDISKEPTPEATITKMNVVRSAALAPSDPSPQDRKVAAAATSMIGEAKRELQLEKIHALEVQGKIMSLQGGRENNGIAGEDGVLQKSTTATDGKDAGGDSLMSVATHLNGRVLRYGASAAGNQGREMIDLVV